MFDISFSELSVAGVVALLVLEPKEFNSLVVYARCWLIKIRSTIALYTESMNKEVLHIKNHVIDLDGHIQPTYELSDIERKVKRAKKAIRRVKQENV